MCAEQPAATSQRAGLSPETRRRLLRAGAATVAASLYIAPHMRTTRLAAAATCVSPAGVQLDASIDTARCDLVQGRIVLRNNSAAQRISVREINAVLIFGGAAQAAPAYAPALPPGADVLLRPGVEVPPGQIAATALSLNPAGRAGAGHTAVALTVTIRYDAGSARLECSAAASGALECHQESNESNGGGDTAKSGGGSGGNGGGGANPSDQRSQQPPPQTVPPPVVPSGGVAQPVASQPGQAVQSAPPPQVSVLAGGQPEVAPLPEMQVSPESIVHAPEVVALPRVPAPAQVPPLAVPLPAAAAPPPAATPGPPPTGPQAAGPAQAATPPASPASQPSVTLPRAGSSASSPAGGARFLGLGSLLLALGRLLSRLAGGRGGADAACRSDSGP